MIPPCRFVLVLVLVLVLVGVVAVAVAGVGGSLIVVLLALVPVDSAGFADPQPAAAITSEHRTRFMRPFY